MDPSSFYRGKSANIVPVPNDSGDEDLCISDDSVQDENYCPPDISDSSLDNFTVDDKDKSSVTKLLMTQNNSKQLKRNSIWRLNTSNEEFQIPEWNDSLHIAESVGNPLEYFSKLVDDETLDFICSQTNLYATQTNIAANFSINRKELVEQFIGICFHMPLIGISGTRWYWSIINGIPHVYEVMTVRRFEEIKRYIHFSDNSQLSLPIPERIFKIRGLVERIRTNLRKNPLEQYLCVHEQVIPCKGKSILKQYNPQKPTKWGYKLFCLAGASGIVYDFEVYAGPKRQPQHLVDIGQSSNVVLRLAELIPSNKGYQLCFDNWFYTTELQMEFYKRGIYCVGTVRPYRGPNCRFPSD